MSVRNSLNLRRWGAKGVKRGTRYGERLKKKCFELAME